MEFDQSHRDMLCDVLKWRRDVRHFKTTPVPLDVWSKVKSAVRFAPSVGNSQPWRMIQVQSPALRGEMVAHFRTENDLAGDTYDADTRRDYLNLKLAGLREAPIHLAVFTQTQPKAGRGLGRQTMPQSLHYSTVTAIHTLWLAARTHNLGVGWVSILNPAFVAELLTVPEDWALTGYLCIGYPAFDDTVPELERRDWQARQDAIWFTR